MTKKSICYFTLFFALLSSPTNAQKVGVVLSGGGASGMAHIGFLRALEENNIPIDCITGTSIGAIIGGLYAAGYSPDEIEVIFASHQFQLFIHGKVGYQELFYFKHPENDPGMVNWRVNPGKPIQTSIPNSYISSYPLDFLFLKYFASSQSVSQGNFDSLYIPFRCTASDIWNKKTKIFRSGHLNNAIRHSATYPFYLEPIDLDGNLYFDGGLYDNFPVTVIQNEFNPDIILGCNVSYNFELPKHNDVISQIKNMLVSTTDYTLKGHSGVMIEPKSNVTTFDFANYKTAIDSGYTYTNRKINAIKTLIKRRISTQEREFTRNYYNNQKKPLLFDDIEVIGLPHNQKKYIHSALFWKKDSLNTKTIEKRYFKLMEDPFISNIYPDAQYNPKTQHNTLRLYTQKQKDLTLSIGGNLSSKPINTGYFGVTYQNILANYGIQLKANTYFGKYYSSVLAAAQVIQEGKYPIAAEGYFVINRWDFFNSKTAFFQESNPPFIITDNKFSGIDVFTAIGKHSKLTIDAKYVNLHATYHQNETFSPTDTALATLFKGFSTGARYSRNSLNRKQFPSKGSQFEFIVRLNDGLEIHHANRLINKQEKATNQKQWIRTAILYDHFFMQRKKFRLGVHFHGEYNSNLNFSNIRATNIYSPAFQPFPETKTIFSDAFRASKFLGAGLTELLSIKDVLELRLSAYIFQPFSEEKSGNNQTTKTGPTLGETKYLVSGGMVFHSPVGPVSMHVNYIEGEQNPWGLFFNIGYVIFNRKALY